MRTFLFLVTVVGILLIATAVGIEVASTDPGMAQQLSNARTLVWRIGESAWSFARPLLQLIAVLLILEWVFSRVGVRLRLNEITTDWNVQTFIAGLIIVTFCIAVLADIQAVSYLKEVVLIVIGFYFGTRARTSMRLGGSGQPVVVTPPPSSPSGYDQIVLSQQPKGVGESQEENEEHARRGWEFPSEPK
jgi:hypothetical protein